jgi:hypothetical protein
VNLIKSEFDVKKPAVNFHQSSEASEEIREIAFGFTADENKLNVTD